MKDKIFTNKIELPHNFRIKWLESLRSKEYNQGKKALYNEDFNNYCCIGVAGVACLGLKPLDLSRKLLPKNLDIEHSVLYPKVLRNTVSTFTKCLIHMNDGSSYDLLNTKGFKTRHYTFEEIADFIELNTVGVKYVAIAEAITLSSLTIEANSIEEARSIAEKEDGGNFTTIEYQGDWNIINIVKIIV